MASTPGNRLPHWPLTLRFRVSCRLSNSGPVCNRYPDPGVAILAFGKRNCAYDISLPVPLDIEGTRVTAINDQHAYLSYPENVKLSVGDRLRFGLSHPCTAFDKWRKLPLVDDDYNVLDTYATFF